MKFYLVSHRKPVPPHDAAYPCAVLVRDNWDDFGFKTTFAVAVHAAPRKIVMESHVKVLQRRFARGRIDPSFRNTRLPEQFESLDTDSCSLGIEPRYYRDLAEAGPEIYDDYLESMRDVVYDESLAKEFGRVPGFRESLLRSSETAKTFSEAGRWFGRRHARKIFAFEYSVKLPGAEEPHRVRFDFRRHRTDLHRIAVLIGRNGTGKTQFIAAFARSMSGLDDKVGEFQPRRPSFSRVIAVSYSALDTFTRPRADPKSKSYVYCGIRSQRADATKIESRLLSAAQLRRRLENSLDLIVEQGRFVHWRKIMSDLIGRKVKRGGPAFDAREAMAIYNELSSGQRVLVAVFTEIIAHIRPDSIVLFDEPELHLHPDIFSALLRAFYDLLKTFHSYAIVATHAPVLLQGTMARQVRVFRRDGNVPLIAPLGIECFGENLSVITKEVFESEDVSSHYRDVLTRLRASGHPIAQIKGMFERGLPLQAESFLHTLSPS